MIYSERHVFLGCLTNKLLAEYRLFPSSCAALRLARHFNLLKQDASEPNNGLIYGQLSEQWMRVFIKKRGCSLSLEMQLHDSFALESLRLSDYEGKAHNEK